MKRAWRPPPPAQPFGTFSDRKGPPLLLRCVDERRVYFGMVETLVGLIPCVWGRGGGGPADGPYCPAASSST